MLLLFLMLNDLNTFFYLFQFHFKDIIIFYLLSFKCLLIFIPNQILKCKKISLLYFIILYLLTKVENKKAFSMFRWTISNCNKREKKIEKKKKIIVSKQIWEFQPKVKTFEWKLLWLNKTRPETVNSRRKISFKKKMRKIN